MVDETVPPAILPPVPPRPEFTSPYGMYPNVDAARDELAVREAERGNVIDPLAVPFDPTKPTIDQTRSNAIDSIRNNFAALTSAAAIDPTIYLKKTGGLATDLTVTHPTSTTGMVLNPIAGQVGAIYWFQASANKFAAWVSADSSTWIVTAYPDAGGPWNVFSARRSDGAVAFGNNVAISAGFARTSQGAAVHLEINKPTPVFLMQHSDGGALRLLTNAAGTYIDAWLAATGADVAPVAGARSLFVRTQDSTGAVQTRLTFDPSGAMLAGVGAFVGAYRSLGAGSFAPDFRLGQTVGVAPGATITSVTLAAGQVGRIFVTGGGAITIPSTWRVQQGGAVWGTVNTIVSLFSPDGATILATFVPFQAATP
jgi:hypothetical protein